MTSIQSHCAESLDALVGAKTSFACWFLPGDDEPALMVLPDRPAELADIGGLPDKEAFVFAPFSVSAHRPALVFAGVPVCRGFAGFPKCDLPQKGSGVAEQAYQSTSAEQYRTMFDRFMGELKSGRFSKLVLSRVFAAANRGRSIGQIFFGIRSANPLAFTYLLYAPQCGLWLGASPEILLEKRNDAYQTVALAGTMPVDGRSDYAWGGKEREEQQIVADYINEQLLRCGVADMAVSDAVTAVAGNVAHLKTTFRFRSDARVGVLAKQLHPTPAVCGLPKGDAWHFLQEAEMHDREYYAGIVGVAGNGGSANLYVNLRCMKATEHQFVLFAGGGITLLSDCGKEWAETAQKLKMLLSAIGNDETVTL